MVGKGGIRVDWLEGRGGEFSRMENGGEDGEWEEEKETTGESGKRRREEDDHEEEDEVQAQPEEEMVGKELKDDENEMLELRLSLGVATSVAVPSSPAATSYVRPSQQGEGILQNHQQQNQLQDQGEDQQNHQNPKPHHQQQQQGEGNLQNHQQKQGDSHQNLQQKHLSLLQHKQISESPIRQQQPGPSSPRQDRIAARPSLAASLKHLTSQQPPLKSAKASQSNFTGPTRQLRSSPPPPLRSSSSLPHSSSMESEEMLLGEGALFQNRFTSRSQSGSHFSTSNRPIVSSKSLPPQRTQPRASAHPVFSRIASLDVSHLAGQASPVALENHQENGFASTSASVLPRILGSIPRAVSSAQQQPGTGLKLHSFLQPQASSSNVLAAAHRQTHHQSAFAELRSLSGSMQAGIPVLDAGSRDRGGDGAVVVKVCDRKVQCAETDSPSLYALCRRWVRNDVPRRDQTRLWDSQPLPVPIPAPLPERPLAERNSGAEEESGNEDGEVVADVDDLSEVELLQLHVEHGKKVRKRLKEERAKRVERFMHRLALLLPNHYAYPSRQEGVTEQS